jgi:hypothetical protein
VSALGVQVGAKNLPELAEKTFQLYSHSKELIAYPFCGCELAIYSETGTDHTNLRKNSPQSFPLLNLKHLDATSGVADRSSQSLPIKTSSSRGRP